MKDFIWTDELVGEYTRWLRSRSIPVYDPISEFKEAHKPKKDYEILEFKNTEGIIYELTNEGWYRDINHRFENNPWRTEYHLLTNATHCKINSVKRISDGEVFSIGNKMLYRGDSDIKDIMTITHFSLKNDEIFVNNHYAGTPNVRIKDWIKVNEKKSLFTTEQQNEIISIVKKAIEDAI